MNIIWGSTGRNSFGNNSVGSGWCWFAPLPALVSFSPVQILHPWVQGLNVVPGSLKPPWRLTYDTLYLFIHLFIPNIAFNKECGQEFLGHFWILLSHLLSFAELNYHFIHLYSLVSLMWKSDIRLSYVRKKWSQWLLFQVGMRAEIHFPGKVT